MLIRHFFIFITGLLFVACSKAPPSQDTQSDSQNHDAVYYLVRHAEKVLDVKDPPLTKEGEARATALSNRLSGVQLTKIYSSDYQRTRDTAAPTSAAQNIEILLYDPSDLPGAAEMLKAQSGIILVVGHSNTTPQLAELMGAPPGEPIVEATEYDRLYIIHRKGDAITGKIETYGKPSP